MVMCRAKGFLSAVTIFVLMIGTVVGQEDLKKYPPRLFKPSIVKNSLDSLVWQLEQLEALNERYRASRDEIRKGIEKIDSQVKQLNREIPSQIGNLDNEIRSRLIGNAMQKKLDTSLKLVSLEETLQSLEKRFEENADKEAGSSRAAELQIATKMAYKRFELAQNEYDKLKKLQKTGSMSAQQTERAGRLAEIAQLEYRAAQMGAKVEEEDRRAEAATEIANLRTKVIPARAELNAIEVYLHKISEASEIIEKIEKLKYEKNLLFRDLEMVAERLFDLGRKKMELSTLRDLIQEKMKVGSEE